jgi:short-subunit dehydrogenase
MGFYLDIYFQLNFVFAQFKKKNSILLPLYNTLESKYNIKVFIIEADLSSPEILKKLKKIINDKKIGILVNAIGISHTPSFFHLTDSNSLEKVIDVNIKSCILITKIVLPQMLKR